MAECPKKKADGLKMIQKMRDPGSQILPSHSRRTAREKCVLESRSVGVSEAH
jgi:hypothetical protein